MAVGLAHVARGALVRLASGWRLGDGFVVVVVVVARSQRKIQEAARVKEAAVKAETEKARAAADKRELARREAAEKENQEKAEREMADKQWRKQLATMKSVDIVAASLERELMDELAAIRAKIETGTATVSAIEAEITDTDMQAKKSRDAKTAETASLESELQSISQIRDLVSSFSTQASQVGPGPGRL